MEPEKKSSGALVGLVVVIIILVIGGIYMWQSNQSVMQETQPGTITNQDSTQLNTLQKDSTTTNTSTGVDANTIY